MAKKAQVKDEKYVSANLHVSGQARGENYSPLQGSLFPVLRQNFCPVSIFRINKYSADMEEKIRILSNALIGSIHWDEFIGDVSKLKPYEFIEKLYRLAIKCAADSNAEPYIESGRLYFVITEPCEEGFITDLGYIEDFTKAYPGFAKAIKNVLRVLHSHGVEICNSYYHQLELEICADEFISLSDTNEEAKEHFTIINREHKKDIRSSIKYTKVPDIHYLEETLRKLMKKSDTLSTVESYLVNLLEGVIDLSKSNEKFSDFKRASLLDDDIEPCDIPDLFLICYTNHFLDDAVIKLIDEVCGNYDPPVFVRAIEVTAENVNDSIPIPKFPTLIKSIYHNLWHLINLT